MSEVEDVIARLETLSYAYRHTLPPVARAARLLRTQQQRIEELEKGLEPFKLFADKWDAKPMLGMDNVIYGIHPGTEFEACIRLSDCRHARHLLTLER